MESSIKSLIKNQIENDIKSALRAGEKFKLSTLRMLMAAIKQVEIDDQIQMDDEKVAVIIKKSIKQRQESARQFIDANRNELAEKEQQEIKIIQPYLPAQIEGEQLDQLIQQTIEETGANSIQQMGQVIGTLKQKTGSRADMSVVSAKVKNILSQSS